VFAAACRSDKDFVANEAADYTYQEYRYEARCVKAKGPADCKDHQLAVADAREEIRAAKDVLAIGKLPADEKAAIKAKLKKVRGFK
jgi:hypothetical protein